MSRAQQQRRDVWRELILEQESSGLSVREFCRRRQASEPGFYEWRKRLATESPMKFALVEAGARPAAEAAVVEITLATGERLRVGPGVDAAALRVVLSVWITASIRIMDTRARCPHVVRRHSLGFDFVGA